MMSRKPSGYIFIGLIALYAILLLLVPADPKALAQYNLSETSARLIALAIALPLVAIWVVAYCGYIGIRDYAQAVRGSQEGRAFTWLSKGLCVATISLPIASVAASLCSYATQRNPTLVPTATILRNYGNVALAMVAFFFIGKGAEELARHMKKKSNMVDNQLWTIGFMALASLFSWLVVSHSPAVATGDAVVYYLPDWLVVSTLVILYLYVWYRGIIAAYSIYFYQKKVQGVLYKRALSLFSRGIAVVIFTSMLLQFLTVFTAQIRRLNFTPVLILVYMLLVCYAVGYGLIARGARKLRTIEEA